MGLFNDLLLIATAPVRVAAALAEPVVKLAEEATHEVAEAAEAIVKDVKDAVR